MNLPIESQAIHEILTQRFSPTHLEVIDESAAHAGHAGASPHNRGTHFRIRIAANAFKNQSCVKAHRLIYEALSAFFKLGLHALAIEVVE